MKVSTLLLTALVLALIIVSLVAFNILTNDNVKEDKESVEELKMDNLDEAFAELDEIDFGYIVDE